MCVFRARFFRLDVLRFGTAMAVQYLVRRSVGSARVAAMLAERIPPRLRNWRTVTVAGVQVGAARWAKAFAVWPAEREAGCFEQPVLAHGRTKIELTCVRIDRVHVWVVRIAVLGEDQMHFVADGRRRFGQAASAVERHFPVHAAMPIEASFAS